MTLKITRIPVNNDDEKKLLIGCIVSDSFLNRIHPILNPDLMQSASSRTLLSYILDYYKQYKKAPTHEIEDIVASLEDVLDVSEFELTKNLLKELADNSYHIKFNEDFYYDRASAFLQKNSLLALANNIKQALLTGDVLTAEKAIASRGVVGKSGLHNIDVLNSPEAWVHAFETASAPLFMLPGALGAMLNEYLIRDSLIALLAPEKRGKTFLANELAFRAVMARCNVLIVQCGDMSEEQELERLGVRIAGRSTSKKYCREHYSPVADCLHNQDGTCTYKKRLGSVGLCHTTYESPEHMFKSNMAYTPCAYCKEHNLYNRYKGAVFYEKIEEVEPLSLSVCYKEILKWKKAHHGKHFKLITVPSKTISMTDVDAQCEIWQATEGFIPDVVIIDYADILLPSDKSLKGRDSIDDIWVSIKRFTQKWHCLGLVPTQADFEANNVELLGLDNFSEDKRKRAHITAEVTINQSPHEKKFNIQRLGMTLGRSGEVDSRSTVTILQDLWRGRPLLDNFFTPHDYLVKERKKVKSPVKNSKI